MHVQAPGRSLHDKLEAEVNAAVCAAKTLKKKEAGESQKKLAFRAAAAESFALVRRATALLGDPAVMEGTRICTIAQRRFAATYR